MERLGDLLTILKKGEAERRAWTDEDAAADGVAMKRYSPESPVCKRQARAFEGPQGSITVVW